MIPETRHALLGVALAACGCLRGPATATVQAVEVAPATPTGALLQDAPPARAPKPRSAPPFRWLPCDEARALRSEVSEVSLQMDVTNEADVPLALVWLDFEGRRVEYARLEPGASYLQQTYVTHPWIVLDDQQRCVGMFLPQRSGRHPLVLARPPLAP